MHQSRSIKVLIVEDQADVCLLLRLLIQNANDGLTIVGEAASGDRALACIDEVDPAVVVLDYMMPELNGIETAALIRRRRPDQAIVLCSAFLDEDVIAAATGVGVARCVPKSMIGSVPDTIRDVVAAA